MSLTLRPWERSPMVRALALGVDPNELERYTWIVRALALGCPWPADTTMRAGWTVALAALQSGWPITQATDAQTAVWVARLCSGIDVAAAGGPAFPLQLVTAARKLWRLPVDLVVLPVRRAPMVVIRQPKGTKVQTQQRAAQRA